MKELRKYHEHYTQIFTELSSFMCFVKAVKQVKPNRRVLFRGFDELVNKSDYSKSDRIHLIDWLDKKWCSK